MKALVKTQKAYGLSLVDVPTPTITDTEVLVKIRASSICGTDVHIYNWDNWAQNRVTTIPLIQGHELCGDIVKVGKNVKAVKVGDFVSAESHIVDYSGNYFNRGLGHVAPETKIIGVDTNGSFAEFIALPWQNTRVNPPDMPTRIAVLKENFGNAVHASFKVPLTGKRVLITGCGPVGLMSILAAKAQNPKQIIASDISDYKTDFATKLGADVTINPTKTPLTNTVNEATNNQGVDVLLEMSGAQSALLDGMDCVVKGGDVVVFGIFHSPFEIDLNTKLIFKGLTMHGVVGRLMWQTWEKVEELLSSKTVDLSAIVTHTYKLADYEKAFETMKSGLSGKVMIEL